MDSCTTRNFLSFLVYMILNRRTNYYVYNKTNTSGFKDKIMDRILFIAMIGHAFDSSKMLVLNCGTVESNHLQKLDYGYLEDLNFFGKLMFAMIKGNFVSNC